MKNNCLQNGYENCEWMCHWYHSSFSQIKTVESTESTDIFNVFIKNIRDIDASTAPRGQQVKEDL